LHYGLYDQEDIFQTVGGSVGDLKNFLLNTSMFKIIRAVVGVGQQHTTWTALTGRNSGRL